MVQRSTTQNESVQHEDLPGPNFPVEIFCMNSEESGGSLGGVPDRRHTMCDKTEGERISLGLEIEIKQVF